jgi:hypothetical protein
VAVALEQRAGGRLAGEHPRAVGVALERRPHRRSRHSEAAQVSWVDGRRSVTDGTVDDPGEILDLRMDLQEVIWLEQFVEKIERKHGVEATEVEEVLCSRPRRSRSRPGT